MNQLYHDNKKDFIVYNLCKYNQNSKPTVIFLHGLMSGMHGSKALYIENYCIDHKLNFIKFDNFGHGQSSGDFLNQTISSWLVGVEMVLNNLVDRSAIIVGSSLGGWLALLASIKFRAKITAIICIAPAADFTEDIWNNLPLQDKEKIQQQGWIDVHSSSCDDKYPISYNLIEDAKQYLLLNKKIINLDIPVHLLHGMQDTQVDYKISTTLVNKISAKNIVLKLVKDAGHSFSRDHDLRIITHSIEELLA